MIRASSSAIVKAPAASVWQFVADYSNDPLWREGVSVMRQDAPGLVRDGVEVDEVLAILGRTINSRVLVSSVEPGQSFAWRVVGGASAYGRRWVRPIDADTAELGAEKNLTLRGIERLLELIIAATVRRTEREDLARAARLIEAQATRI